MPPPLDLRDRRFGRLVVIAEAARAYGATMWLTRCDCGVERIVRGARLVIGHTTSCGCSRAKPRTVAPPASLPGCVYVPLTRGLFAIVDEADAALVRGKWFAKKGPLTFYAQGRRDQKTVVLHRFLLNPDVGVEVDHINGDGLDNRRANLRLCLKAENTRNRRKHRSNSSGYKGVTLVSKSSRWQAQIGHDGGRVYLGSFDTAIEAARAYDVAAARLYGAFAHPNLP